VKRELESGWFQWLSMELPACITIQSGINTPRYPSLKGIMGAKKKEIKTASKEELTAQAALQIIDKVYIPKKTKRTEMIEGDAEQVSGRLAEILKRDIRVL
jgi:electron transfer flavoprotein beta subunit